MEQERIQTRTVTNRRLSLSLSLYLRHSLSIRLSLPPFLPRSLSSRSLSDPVACFSSQQTKSQLLIRQLFICTNSRAEPEHALYTLTRYCLTARAYEQSGAVLMQQCDVSHVKVNSNNKLLRIFSFFFSFFRPIFITLTVFFLHLSFSAENMKRCRANKLFNSCFQFVFMQIYTLGHFTVIYVIDLLSSLVNYAYGKIILYTLELAEVVDMKRQHVSRGGNKCVTLKRCVSLVDYALKT